MCRLKESTAPGWRNDDQRLRWEQVHAPALTGFDIDFLDVIETGDWVKVDARLRRGGIERHQTGSNAGICAFDYGETF